SGMIEGSEERTRYGETVVINHTPMAGPTERHMYTLSAHLNARKVHTGQKVEKGKVIGTSGNSGTREFYIGKKKGTERGKEGGFHLHFEVFDASRELKWIKNQFPSGYRKDPINDYIGRIITLEYAFTDEEMKKILNRVNIAPVIDLKRGTWHMDVTIDGKKVGRIDKHTKELKLSLSSKEQEEILRKPVLPFRKKSKVYEVKIG
ncbi:MAG: M23 family metallopeptidase, partial [Desulfobacterales bacterium]|nr:M23 family metallopeptidase [Desulfobacterales bacterium]